MSTLYPEGEAIRRAISWISEHLQENPEAPVMNLVHEAIAQFNLSPKEAEELLHFYRNARPGTRNSEPA